MSLSPIRITSHGITCGIHEPPTTKHHSTPVADGSNDLLRGRGFLLRTMMVLYPFSDMHDQDNHAPATKGDVLFLAKLASDNAQNIEMLGTRFDRFEKTIEKVMDRLERTVIDSASELKRDFNWESKHIGTVNERLEDHEERIRHLERMPSVGVA